MVQAATHGWTGNEKEDSRESSAKGILRWISSEVESMDDGGGCSNKKKTRLEISWWWPVCEGQRKQ